MASWPTDPIFQNDTDGKWYFWNETWSDHYGPFESRELARRALILYSIIELGCQNGTDIEYSRIDVGTK